MIASLCRRRESAAWKRGFEEGHRVGLEAGLEEGREKATARNRNDAVHLAWIHARLVHHHREDPRFDYMVRLRETMHRLFGGEITDRDRIAALGDGDSIKGEVSG